MEERLQIENVRLTRLDEKAERRALDTAVDQLGCARLSCPRSSFCTISPLPALRTPFAPGNLNG